MVDANGRGSPYLVFIQVLIIFSFLSLLICYFLAELEAGSSKSSRDCLMCSVIIFLVLCNMMLCYSVRVLMPPVEV